MAWSDPYLDGFDSYPSANLSARYDSVGSGTTVSTTTTRNSVGSLNTTAGSSHVSKRFPASDNFLVGTAIYLNAAPSGTTIGSAGIVLVGFSSGLSGTSAQLALVLLDDGFLRLVRCTAITSGGVATGAVLLATGNISVSTLQFVHLQVKVFFHDTAGACEVRINGVEDTGLTLTAADTQAQTTNTASVVILKSPCSSTFNDDLYIRYATSGSAAEAGGFLGDLSIKPYYPDADGTYTQMTPSTGTSHFALVDETSPNTTDYVSSGTALQKDSFTFQDSAETSVIVAVQLSSYCYKVDSGFRGIDLFAISGATEDFNGYNNVSTTEKYVSRTWMQDPNTSADWTQTNRNNAEFGVRISADL